MTEINGIGILAIVIGCLLVGGIVVYYTGPKDVTGLTDAEVTAKVVAAVEQAKKVQDTEIERLKALIAEDANKTVEEDIIKIEGYVMDGLFLEIPFYENLSDREVNLFDGEVEFDGKDYDAQELFNLDGLTLLANVNDFEGVPYLTTPRYAISYIFEFETSLNTSLINEDETLTFNLLGKEVTISKWNVDSVTFSQGEEHDITEGKSVTIDEKIVVLDWVTTNAVYVLVDDIGAKIFEGETKKVNGLEIKVSEVLYTEKSTKESKAVLVIGDEVSFEVDNDDEYAEDSIWEWIIDNHSIGLVLIEDFTELDEDYNALALKESICLPNDYRCVFFNSIIEEDSEKYTFKLDSDGFVRVKGNFEAGTKDYDEIYIHNDTGEIYEDDNTENQIEVEVRIGNSDLVISANGSRILIEDSVSEDYLVRIDLDLTQIQVDKTEPVNGTWTNITSKNEDYLTNYGILVKNPDDSIDEDDSEDTMFTLTIPEEKLEGTIIVK